jgi:hypothetical protein
MSYIGQDADDARRGMDNFVGMLNQKQAGQDAMLQGFHDRQHDTNMRVLESTAMIVAGVSLWNRWRNRHNPQPTQVECAPAGGPVWDEEAYDRKCEAESVMEARQWMAGEAFRCSGVTPAQSTITIPEGTTGAPGTFATYIMTVESGPHAGHEEDYRVSFHSGGHLGQWANARKHRDH